DPAIKAIRSINFARSSTGSRTSSSACTCRASKRSAARAARAKEGGARRSEPAPLAGELRAVLGRVEEWYRGWHELAVREVAESLGLAPDPWLDPKSAPGWLSVTLRAPLEALRVAFAGLHAVAVASASLTDEASRSTTAQDALA